MIKPYSDRIKLFRAIPEEEFLLKAILLEGEAATEAWRIWRRMTNVEEHASRATVTLLPFVYQKFSGIIDDPIVEIGKGVYRRTWYLNAVLFKHAADVINLLQAQGIRTMVLKGAALALAAYEDQGLRRMDDVDILVPFADKLRAVELLNQHGWKLHNSPFEKLPQLFLEKHGEEFRSQADKAIDLHWNIFYASRQQELDDICWERSLPLTLQTAKTRMLCPTDQLLHVLIHGMSYRPKDQVRWVVDAFSVMRAFPIDWDLMVIHAAERRLGIQLKDSLRYLRDVFNAPVPESALELLEKLPETQKDYALYSYYSWRELPQEFLDASSSYPRPFQRLISLWRKYMLSLWTFKREEETGVMTSLQKFLGFINYLRAQSPSR